MSEAGRIEAERCAGLEAAEGRASRIAIRDLTAGADRGAELKTLKDEVGSLRQDNRRPRDRMTALEARLDGGTKRRSGRGTRGRRRGGSR